MGCGIPINRLAKFHEIEDEDEDGHEDEKEDEEESEREEDEETEEADGEEENWCKRFGKFDFAKLFAKFHETDDQDEDEDEEYKDEDDEEEEEGEKGQEAEKETEVVDGEEENRCKQFGKFDVVKSRCYFLWDRRWG